MECSLLTEKGNNEEEEEEESNKEEDLGNKEDDGDGELQVGIAYNGTINGNDSKNVTSGLGESGTIAIAVTGSVLLLALLSCLFLVCCRR